MKSLVIPVYGNESTIPELLELLEGLDRDLGGDFEAVFVVDGSQDHSVGILRQSLPRAPYRSQLVEHSRNFGSFAAIRSGLAEAEGPFFAVMAADLQEPVELILRFFRILASGDVDVVVGTRESRDDPLLTRWLAQLYWAVYRRFVQPEMPPGGADIFGCNQVFRDRLLTLQESNSSLIGLLFWVGFRRQLVGYHRLPRRAGTSGWSLRRRVRYMTDSVFAFSDLPVRLLTLVGSLGLAFSIVCSAVVFLARLMGGVKVPGYAATALFLTFLTALNSFGLGIIGSYVWRAFENTKRRPNAIVMSRDRYAGRPP